MEAFKPHVIISQSLDGKTLTITDNSNFATNTDGVATGDINPFAITIFDKDAIQLAAIALAYPTPGTFAIVKDLFLRFHLAYTKGATVYSADVTYLSTEFYDIAQRKVSGFLSCDCGCSDLLCHPASKARENKNAAESALIAGDYVNAQQAIDDANTYINQALKSC